MAIFQNTKTFFHFHVYYREAWNGNVNYRGLLFVIFNRKMVPELYEGPSKRSYACIQFSFERGLN